MKRIFQILGMLTLNSLSSILYAQIPTNGLVAYYPFNGNANDASGNGRNGTVSGAILTADRNGNANSAYYFNGSSSITLSNTANLPLAGNTDWSILCRFKISPQTSGNISLFYKPTSTSTTLQYVSSFYINSNDTLTGCFGTDSYIQGGWANSLTKFKHLSKASNWTSILIVKKSDTTYYYNNGILIKKTLFPWLTRLVGNGNVILGSWSGGQNLIGYIDDFAVWNRALTVSEVLNISEVCNVNNTVNIYNEYLVSSQSFNTISPKIYLEKVSNLKTQNGACDSVVNHYSKYVYNATNTQIPTNGLVAYYPFNGNANDASGNGRNGTVSGATLTTDRFGNTNSAYSFNGSSYIFCGNISQLSTSTSPVITFSYWMKYNIGTGTHDIFDLRSTNNTNIGNMVNYPNSNNFSAINYNAPVAQGKVWVANQNIQNLIWTHVITEFNYNTGNSKIYMNGQLIQPSILSPTTSLGALTNPKLNIGSRFDFYNSRCCYFNGILDDFRIYNRELTTSEISSLYNENICYQTISVTDTLRIESGVTAGLNELPANFGAIKIYPNPTKDVLNIAVSNPSPNYTIKIINSTSQTLYSTQLSTSSFQLNLNTLGSKGLYFIQILDNTNKVLETKKLVLE